MTKLLFLTLAVAACLTLAVRSPVEAQSQAPAKEAPAVFKVNLDTSKGPVVLEIHRDWAPIGVDHFYQLVEAKFFDGARFFRVLPTFVIQFGLSGKPEMNVRWAHASLRDDPVKQHNSRGSVTYATAGPNTRSTQLFINVADNAQLDSMGFAPIGKVISGMNFVDHFYSGYGEISGAGGSGPDPSQIERRGDEYVQARFPKLDYIKTATIE